MYASKKPYWLGPLKSLSTERIWISNPNIKTKQFENKLKIMNRCLSMEEN